MDIWLVGPLKTELGIISSLAAAPCAFAHPKKSRPIPVNGPPEGSEASDGLTWLTCHTYRCDSPAQSRGG